MTGRRWTPAQFMASWKSPREVEPSPNHVIATALLAAHLERHREPGRDQHHVGEHRDHPDAALGAVAEVHVAVAPAGDAVLAAHVLGEDPLCLDAADDVRGEVAVEDAEAVLRRPSPTRGRPRRPPARTRRRTSRGPCPGDRASSRAPRCRASSASRAAVRPGHPWSGAPIRPAGLPAKSRTEQLRSPCGVFPFDSAPPGSSGRALPRCLAPGRDLRRAEQGYLETVERQEDSLWVTRMRWRMRGAWLWPSFVALTLAEGVALELLPIAGDGPGGIVPGVLLAGFANLIAVATLAPARGLPAAPTAPRPAAPDRRQLRRHRAAVRDRGVDRRRSGSSTARRCSTEPGRPRRDDRRRCTTTSSPRRPRTAPASRREARAARGRPLPHLRARRRPEALALPVRQHRPAPGRRRRRRRPRAERRVGRHRGR